MSYSQLPTPYLYPRQVCVRPFGVNFDIFRVPTEVTSAPLARLMHGSDQQDTPDDQTVCFRSKRRRLQQDPAIFRGSSAAHVPPSIHRPLSPIAYTSVTRTRVQPKMHLAWHRLPLGLSVGIRSFSVVPSTYSACIDYIDAEQKSVYCLCSCGIVLALI